MATANEIQTEAPAIVSARFTHLIEYLAGVRKMSSLAKKSSEKNALLDAIVRILFEHLNAEDVSLYLLEEEVLHCVANLNWEKFIEDTSAVGTREKSCKLGEELVGKTAAEKKVQYIADCALHKDTDARNHHYSAGSVIYSPIMNDSKLIGIVELYHPYSNHFDHWQEYAVGIYSDLIAMLLEYHELVTDMQGQIDSHTAELKKALKESDRLRQRYEEMSIIDHLTRLYNRRFFFNEVASGLSRAVRYEQPFSLLLMDLDHFKTVNDDHGHDCGDEMLKHIATIMSNFIREGDTLARYGGEEFILALPNTGLDGAKKLAERIRHTIESSPLEHKTDQYESTNVPITVSIGIASMRQNTENDEDIVNYNPQVADLIREADRALYFVKQHGRNAVRAFVDLPQS